jgi:hypothetical protein
MTMDITTFKKFFYFFFLSFLFYSRPSLSQSDTNQKKTKPFARIELTSNFLEYGYTETEGSFALVTDVGYQWEQFQIGVRGHNVHFKEETAHLKLQPHLSIISNFSSSSRFLIEHEERLYFSNADNRNGSKALVSLEIDHYKIQYDSLRNWLGTQFNKSRFSFHSTILLGQDLETDFHIGYNMVTNDQKSQFFDGATRVRYMQDNLHYYGELTVLSSLVLEIPNANQVGFRIGIQAEF